MPTRPSAICPAPDLPKPPSPKGPGILEACGWTLCYLFAQGLAAAACVALLLFAAANGWPPTTDAALQLLLDLNLDSNFLLTGVTTLGALFMIVPAVRLRLGPAARERLQLTRPDFRLLLLTIGALAPLAVVGKALYQLALEHWNTLVDRIPQLAPLSRSNTLEALAAQSAHEPFGILVVALALGPALGEEIVFRGLIGSGLTRRWGIPLGVTATCLLFACVHGFPPHAVAVLPLAFFLHYALLTTRSLWTPIVLHFLNNLLAVAMLRFPLLAELPVTPAVLAGAALYVLVVVVQLRSSCRVPARLAWPAHGERASLRSAWLHAMAGGCILGFTTAFVWSVIAGG